MKNLVLLFAILLSANQTDKKTFTVQPLSHQAIDNDPFCALTVTVDRKDVEFRVPCMDKSQMAEIVAIFTRSEALKHELEKGDAITLTITTKRAHQ